MISNKFVPFIAAFTACLLIGFGYGQDYLEGGFVRSGDYGDIQQYFTDPIFYSPGSGYASSGPDSSNKNVALLGSLAKRARLGASKTETMDYAGTKWSFRTHPRSSDKSPSIQSPVTITGRTPATIISQGMRGYLVFLDEKYIGTEGTSGDVIDGRFDFEIIGNQYHEVRVYDGHLNYMKIIYFPSSVPKTIYVEQGTGVYI